MAAKTPSKGIDQNQDGKFVDKYWGRVPRFLKLVPESFICEPNPEFLELMQMYLDGTIEKDNIEPATYYEIENIMLNIGCPCLLDGIDRAIMNAFLGNEPCPEPSHKLICGETICCNSWVKCESPTICDDGGDD